MTFWAATMAANLQSGKHIYTVKETKQAGLGWVAPKRTALLFVSDKRVAFLFWQFEDGNSTSRENNAWTTAAPQRLLNQRF